MIPAKGRFRKLLPALAGAAVSVVLARSGILAPFFLVPLGMVAFRSAPSIAWLAVILSSLAQISIALVSALSLGGFWGGFLSDAGYFSVAAAVLVWVVVPTASLPGIFRQRSSYRYLSGALLASLALWPIVYFAARDATLTTALREQAEAMLDLYRNAAGADVVRKSMLEQQVTVDLIVKTTFFMALRGVAVLIHAGFLVFSVQLARLFSRTPRNKDAFVRFFVHPQLIWVLSLALLAILAGTRFTLQWLEIPAWNVLFLTLMLYLAQGFGIVVHTTRRAGFPAAGRLLVNVFFLLLVISPGINAVVLGALALLGIAENWLPLRAPKSNGPSSTPGA